MANLRIAPQITDLYSHRNPGAGFTPNRSDKAQSFLGEVLPSALQIGTNAWNSSSSGGNRTGAGAAPATVTGTSGTLGGLGASTFAKTSSIIGGLWGAANLIQGWGRSTPMAGATNGMAVGATIGSFVAPGIGTAIGAAAGMLVGGLIGCITSGKHKDQKVRDAVRENLLRAGIIDENYSIGLADGSRYNIGIDGGPKAEFGGRRPFEVDFSNPLAKSAVAWMNPVVHLGIGGNEKIKTDFVGYLANAAMSNAKSLEDVRDNVQAIFGQFGVNDESLAQGIVSAAQQGLLDEQTAMAYLGGIDERRNLPDIKLESAA
jgi:hypothetical protein